MSEKKSKNSQNDQEVVINLDSFAVPGAIILAGIIIAAAIFFTNKSNPNPDVAGNTDTNNQQDAQDQFTDASTNIDDDFYVGNKDSAKVAIVEFSDYQCPYCQRHAQETYSDLIENYVDSGQAIYVFRDFPLEMHGQIAIDTAEASECVAEIEPGKFVEFHDKAFMVADRAALDKVASDMGIDKGRYDTCMSERKYKAEVEKDLSDGMSAGVQGTPGFVIGVLGSDGSVTGKLVAGAYPFESFAEILDEMLAE